MLSVMSRYDDYELTQTDGTYTYFPYNTTPDPNNIGDTLPDLFITDSLDAATSSLQLGTDPLETQVIEIGSAGVTTTVYGAVNLLHPINVLSVTVTNDLNVGGKTTLANVSATDLTSTGIGASILKTTTLNATGTSTLGPLYAGNCSLWNVSAARVDLNTLTAVNCSVSNVSVSRLDANTLTAGNVSTTNLTVGNVLSTIPIHTGYTNVAETVGSAISLNTFTYATPNGVAAQIGQDNFYTYTSTYDPPLEYNMITGKLNLTPVFAQTTYRVCISVNALNNPVDLSFQDDVSTLFTIGTIETSPRKKYVFYLKPTVTGRLYLTITRAALSGAVEIQYDFLSVDAWYETNLTTVNATGSALLASSGGQVGVGTTDPRYTLDVSGSMRVTGETYIGTISKTFVDNLRFIAGTFNSIEENIASEFGGRVYKRVFGTPATNTQLTEQTLLATVNGAGAGVVIPVFQLDIPAGTQYTTQFFDITGVGWIDEAATYLFNGSFIGGINASNTACFFSGTGSGPYQFGQSAGLYAGSITFTLSVNRITVNFTQTALTGYSNITFRIVSNIGRPGQNQFLIRALC